MTDDFKNYTIVRYCVGWNFDGPIYATHFLQKINKGSKKVATKASTSPGWKFLNKCFKHKHND